MRLLLFASFFHLILADSNCPSGYFYQNGLNKCLLTSAAATWNAASNLCVRSGGNLLSIHSAQENLLIAGLQFDLNGDYRGWLGAQQINGSWGWTDGSTFDYQRFQQPDLKGCIYLDAQDMVWKGADCSIQLPFLCSTFPITTTTPSTNTTTAPLTCLPDCQQPLYNCQQEWQYFPTTGYQYKVIFDQNFTDAEANCVRQGGHLASIHSEEENDFVTHLCCTSGDLWHGHQDGLYAIYFIGGQRMNGEISWTDGSPFDYNHTQWCADDKKDGAYLMIFNVHCGGSGSCRTPGNWYMIQNENDDVLPYSVCKRTFR